MNTYASLLLPHFLPLPVCKSTSYTQENLYSLSRISLSLSVCVCVSLSCCCTLCLRVFSLAAAAAAATTTRMSSSAAVSSSSPDRLALEIRKASQAQRQAEQRSCSLCLSLSLSPPLTPIHTHVCVDTHSVTPPSSLCSPPLVSVSLFRVSVYMHAHICTFMCMCSSVSSIFQSDCAPQFANASHHPCLLQYGHACV